MDYVEQRRPRQLRLLMLISAVLLALVGPTLASVQLPFKVVPFETAKTHYI